MRVALTTLLMAMVPVIELRGAIPYGVVEGLSVSQALILSIIGNLIPVPALIIFTKRVFAWLRTKSEGLNAFVCKMEAKAESKKETVEKYEFFGLMLLVAIPLPGTGAWTGTLAASLLDMDFKSSVTAIMCGVLLAGIIIGAAGAGLFGAIGALFG